MVKEIGVGLLLANTNPVILLVVAAAARGLLPPEEAANTTEGPRPEHELRENEMA